MVSSPMYDRLKVFMEAAKANQSLDAWDADHKKTMQGFADAIERLTTYREGHGFTGETGNAMNDWVEQSIKRIEGYRARYERGHSTYQQGRDVMASALREAETISPDLIDEKTAAMRDDWVVSVPESQPGGGITFMGQRFTTGGAYVEALEAQANAQREAAAERVLNMVNSLTGKLGTRMKNGDRYDSTTPPSSTNGDGSTPPGTNGPGNTPGSGSNPGWGYSPSDGYGREAGRDPRSGAYPGGFDQPWLSEADAAAARNRTIASGALETREPAYGEVGSRTNPITDPQDLMGTDLLHTRVNGTAYRNGVVGGHTPAPPADAGHPLWRLNGGGASSSDSSVAGRLGGAGVLGAGGLGLRGAARMGSSSLGSAGGLGAAGLRGMGGAGAAGLRGMSGAGAAGLRGVSGSTGAGAAGLKVGSYSGSGFGSYKPPAGVAGANGVAGSGAAGSSGVTGTTGAGGAGGAAGAAGRGGAGAGGFMGGAGAGAGAGKQEKKSRRRKYVAFRFEDEDEDGLPAGYVNPMSQTYGSDKDIAPAKRADDGWDPRQW